ncbi:MAG: TolC family protein [Muribaculaceae bacterium]
MKKAKMINLIVAAMCTTATSLPARAETDASGQVPVLWSYAECVDYAKSHNISLQQSQLSRQSGLLDLEAAKAQWFPSLNFSTSQGFTNYPRPADGMKSNSYSGSYGLSAGWTIYNGGKRENTIKRNQLNDEVNSLAVEAIHNNLETEILVCYLQILYARDAIAIAKQTCEVSRVQKERAQQLMEAGRMSRVDYVQLESQFLNDEYNVVSAEATYNSRRLELKKLLELGIDVDMQLPELNLDDTAVLQPLPEKADVYAAAVAWLPELKSLGIEGEMSDLDVKIARAGYAPTITLNGSVGTGNGSGTGYSFGNQLLNGLNEHIGVTLSIPIFDNKTNKTNVAKAKIDKLNTSLKLQSSLNDVARSVESYYIEAQNAQAKYVSGKKQLASAELTDELTNEQFKLGLVNTLDLLSSHNTLLNARQELLQSKYMAILNIKMLDFYSHKGITL